MGLRLLESCNKVRANELGGRALEEKSVWRFPPLSGGVDVVNDPSRAYFGDSPVPKLVREVIQNSMDAKDYAFDEPVVVRFSEMEIERDVIGGVQLSEHVKSCLMRAERDDFKDLALSYRRALEACERERVRCLRVQDTGTVGLSGFHWSALVRQEGRVNKETAAAGGSFGIGKNAVLNVSDLNTVFYSTRYVRGRKGRVEQVQGKSTLMSHPDPHRADEMLQHVGFFGWGGGEEPILGRANMPSCFALDETGAGVFIMGFNPRSANDDWVGEMAIASAENFFIAIHDRRLRVEIESIAGKRVSVNHETLASVFDEYGDNSAIKYFYRAVRDRDSDIGQTERLRKLGILNGYMLFSEGAPRRVAYVNRRGMLITDSNEISVNPLRPRNRSIWPDYAVVVMADDDAGDAWIRKMENPSHDSVSPKQLGNEREIREARGIFLDARRALRNMMDESADIAQYGKESNLDELADVFRDELDPTMPGSRRLEVKRVNTRIRPLEEILPVRGVVEEEEDEDNPNDPRETNGGGGGKKRGGGNTDARPPRRRMPSIRSPRFIPKGKREAVVAFTAQSSVEGAILLGLVPAGADRYQGKESQRPERIKISRASFIDGGGVGCSHRGWRIGD